MMQLISHRGYWKTPAEKNAPVAFARSFNAGFGTETDLRDAASRLVISHDPPGPEALPAETFFGIYQGIGADLPLALNVKSDGLQKLLPPLLERFGVTNWFAFDMAVPDALGWLRAGAPCYTRQSEYEEQPAFYSRAVGVWLDGFEGDWWTTETIRRHCDAGKKVCVVSPELHGRDPRSAWDRLRELRSEPSVMLCTDRPEEAREVLHG